MASARKNWTRKASSDQQAVLLLKALIPASNTYDPLAARSAQVQQSGGLAASVAGMFFGNAVGLAAGGAALFQNLKTALFPNTEFRSAFAQAADKDRPGALHQEPGAQVQDAHRLSVGLSAYRN